MSCGELNGVFFIFGVVVGYVVWHLIFRWYYDV